MWISTQIWQSHVGWDVSLQLMSLHAAAASCPIFLIGSNPSHIRVLCYSLPLWQLATHAVWEQACGAELKLTATLLTLSCPHKDPGSLADFQGHFFSPSKTKTTHTAHHCVHHLPQACSVSCLSRLSKALRLVSCGIRLKHPDWTLMGSYDVSSLGICSCWLQAEGLWHTMSLLISWVLSHSLVIACYYMLYY